jgi:1,2-dihydroxy-3-keto-5-methylthiopentene dioxygenase
MAQLTVFDDASQDTLLTTRDVGAIATELRKIGVELEQWTLPAPLPANATDADVLAAYGDAIKRLADAGGYKSWDVIRMFPDNPKKDELRAKFLDEHVHAEDEVRFFVEGAGMFYLHANGRVHMLLCEAGDLISVPAGLQHWFDMGPSPHFCAIRLFTSPEGWVAKFTGAPIASSFPRYEAQTA